MATEQNTPRHQAPQSDLSPAMTDAVAIVLSELTRHAKPKAVAKAKAALLQRAEVLETFEGCRLPSGVVSIYEWRFARASVAQRQERAEYAAAIRSVVARMSEATL